MSKYTAEQVESLATEIHNSPSTSISGTHISLSAVKIAQIYNALCGYATLLRERESAKAWVTEVQKLERWGKAPAGSKYLLQPMDDGYWTPWHIAQQALEAVAPMLSARVPDETKDAQRYRLIRSGKSGLPLPLGAEALDIYLDMKLKTAPKRGEG